MRLMNVHTYKLEFFAGKLKPVYAILSHTWGAEEDEVSYEDLCDIEACKLKPGFKKIEFTCAQAKQEGINYVWIDSSNINRASKTELEGAINSMYDYYGNAIVCYAYLVDVEAVSESNQHSIKQQIKQSRYWKRGWTLQELLAPKKVQFFDKNGVHIGSKSSFKDEIAEITGIDSIYLTSSHGTLNSVNLSTRMYWVSTRETTRPEDLAYCLMGICNVRMPLFYGEGEAGAFARLQAELYKNTSPTSLLSWGLGYPSLGKYTLIKESNFLHEIPHILRLAPSSILASHPKSFTCPKLISTSTSNFRSWVVNNQGINVGLLVITQKDWYYTSSDKSSSSYRKYDLAIALLPFRVPEKPWNIGVLLCGDSSRGIYNRAKSLDGYASVFVSAQLAVTARPTQICLTDNEVFHLEDHSSERINAIQSVHFTLDGFDAHEVFLRGCKWESGEQILQLHPGTPERFQEALFKITAKDDPSSYFYVLLSKSVIFPWLKKQYGPEILYRFRRLGIKVLDSDYEDKIAFDSSPEAKQQSITSNERRITINLKDMTAVISLDQKQVYWDKVNVLTIREVTQEEMNELDDMDKIKSLFLRMNDM